MICALHQILIVWSNQEEWNGRNIWHIWWREGMHTDLCFGNLREGDNFEDQGMYERIILKLILRE
jgi:hypothetical protein